MQSTVHQAGPGSPNNRRGTSVVLAAVCLVVVLAMVAFSVDLGYIATAKAQLQNAADAASLSGALELYEGLGPDTSKISEAADDARQASIAVAALNPAAGLGSVKLSTANIELGRRVWNDNGGHTDSWGAAPYNLIRVTAERDSSSSDGPINTFFARALGHKTVDVSANATVVLHAAAGFGPGANVLPITYDVVSWNAYLAGTGGVGDSRGWNGSHVTGKADGIPELNLYPNGGNNLPSGNRGTLTFSGGSNGTSDLNRQILDGLNENDLAPYGGEINLDDGPITVPGNPGISGGIEHSLDRIVGETRCIPLFSSVTGTGSNAAYTIVKFVGVRIMKVKLSGSNKHVLVQPAPMVMPNAIISTKPSATTDYVFAPPKLTQ